MKEILSALMAVLDEEHAKAVMDHRKVTVKKPLTVFAAKLLAKRLSEWAGGPNEAAEIMIEKCWQGFDRAWVRDRMPTIHQQQQPQQKVMMADLTLDLLTQLDARHVN